MRVQAGSRHIFPAQRLSCFWQRRERLHVWAINYEHDEKLKIAVNCNRLLVCSILIAC